MLEWARRADRVDTRDVAAELLQHVALLELGRPPTVTRKDGKAESVERRERSTFDGDRCDRGNFRRSQFADERMLLEDRFVGPPRRPIEFRDDRRRVVARYLVNAILVAVERKQASVAANADTVERVEHAVRRQAGVWR